MSSSSIALAFVRPYLCGFNTGQIIMDTFHGLLTGLPFWQYALIMLAIAAIWGWIEGGSKRH
jgi:hypothetical protein